MGLQSSDNGQTGLLRKPTKQARNVEDARDELRELVAQLVDFHRSHIFQRVQHMEQVEVEVEENATEDSFSIILSFIQRHRLTDTDYAGFLVLTAAVAGKSGTRS